MHSWLIAIISFISVLAILSRISSTAKYHIKYIGFCLYCIFIAAVSGGFCLVRPGSSKNVIVAKTVIFIATQFEWLFGVDIQIEDGNNIMNAEKPFVAVSNHQTALDAIILIKVAPNGTAPLAKKILLYVPIFGLVCWLCGTVFINRKKGTSAIDIMKKVGQEMMEKITSLWIFPEGTRIQLDKVMSFKKGAFHLAIQAQVPIVPVVIGNYRNVIDRKNRLFDGGTIRVKCLSPIMTTGLTAADVDDLVERVHKLISDGFDEDFKGHPEAYKDLIPLKTE